MKFQSMSTPVPSIFRLLVSLASITLFAIFTISNSVAQTHRPRHKTAPKAQQSVTPKPAPVPASATQPSLVFSPWTKVCSKDADPSAKRVCVTMMDGRIETGLLVVSVAIIEREGEKNKQLRMSLPYGVSLQHGAHLTIDHGRPVTAPFVTCLPPVVPPGGCIADQDATASLINRIKKGQVLTVEAIHMNGQTMSPQLDLKNFAKAYDGPPIDPKAFQDQQDKFQDELQKRAEETRKRALSQQSPAR